VNYKLNGVFEARVIADFVTRCIIVGCEVSRPSNMCSCVLQLVDWRVEFSRWWVNEFKTVKFPSQGTVFDYYIDTETKKFEPWSKKVPTFELDPDIPLQATAETLLLINTR